MSGFQQLGLNLPKFPYDLHLRLTNADNTVTAVNRFPKILSQTNSPTDSVTRFQAQRQPTCVKHSNRHHLSYHTVLSHTVLLLRARKIAILARDTRARKLDFAELSKNSMPMHSLDDAAFCSVVPPATTVWTRVTPSLDISVSVSVVLTDYRMRTCVRHLTTKMFAPKVSRQGRITKATYCDGRLACRAGLGGLGIQSRSRYFVSSDRHMGRYAMHNGTVVGSIVIHIVGSVVPTAI